MGNFGLTVKLTVTPLTLSLTIRTYSAKLKPTLGFLFQEPRSRYPGSALMIVTVLVMPLLLPEWVAACELCWVIAALGREQ